MPRHYGGMTPARPIASHAEPARISGIAPSARGQLLQEIPMPNDIDIDIDLVRAARSKHKAVYKTAAPANIINTAIYADIYVQWTQAIECFNEYHAAIQAGPAGPAGSVDNVVLIDYPNMAFGINGGRMNDAGYKVINSYLHRIITANPRTLFVAIANGSIGNRFTIKDNFHNIKVMCNDVRYNLTCREAHGFVEADDFVMQLVYKFYGQFVPVGVMSQDKYDWFGTSTRPKARNTYVTIAGTYITYSEYDNAVWAKFMASIDTYQPMDTHDDPEWMDTSADIDWMDTNEDIDWKPVASTRLMKLKNRVKRLVTRRRDPR